jgi:hypothetical protein
LDLTIHRERAKLEFGIYRKPTQTHTITLNDSCHPYEHKIASINFLMNRVHRYPITNEAKTKEINNIQDTLCANEYNRNLSISHSKNEKHNKNTSPQHPTTKWAIFTYY